MVFVVLRYCMTEVRDTTRSSEMSARLVRMSSWMPSVKKPLSFSSLMLLNGRTARDFSLTTGTVGSGALAATAGADGTGAGSGLAVGRNTTKAPSTSTATTSKAAAQGGNPARGAGAEGEEAAEETAGLDPAAGLRGDCNRRFTCSTNCGVGSPPGSRVHCDFRNCSGTLADVSAVSSTTTGKRNGRSSASRCVRSTASFHSSRK